MLIVNTGIGGFYHPTPLEATTSSHIQLGKTAFLGRIEHRTDKRVLPKRAQLGLFILRELLQELISQGLIVQVGDDLLDCPRVWRVPLLGLKELSLVVYH